MASAWDSNFEARVARLELRISSSRITSIEGQDLRLNLYALVVAWALVGLAWLNRVRIARSSPEILQRRAMERTALSNQ